MITTRRSLITGLLGLVAAPAIVRATSIMSVKPWDADLLGFNAYERLGPRTEHVMVGGRSRFLGLAQMKQEGVPVAFDSMVLEYPVAPGETIRAGDPVFLNQVDGYAYGRFSEGDAHSELGIALGVRTG